jgi:hypothetical protein
VYQGEARWASPKNGDEYIASGGFDGCVGIVIASPKGAIVAHYGPQKEVEGELRIPQLKENIESHATDLYESGTSYIFGATGSENEIEDKKGSYGFDDKGYKYDSAWQVEKVISFLKEDEVVKEFKIKKKSYWHTGYWGERMEIYDKLPEAEQRTKGTILVEFAEDEKTVAYLEGQAHE